jgi:hypothetical protein
VGREYEPTVGQWYEDLENDETFQVLRVDEDREVVEIQHLDGDIEELDVDGWAELDLELSEEPEGWSGSKAEKDAEEDDDDDWDDEDEDDDDDDDDDDLDDEDDEDREEYYPDFARLVGAVEPRLDRHTRTSQPWRSGASPC